VAEKVFHVTSEPVTCASQKHAHLDKMGNERKVEERRKQTNVKREREGVHGGKVKKLEEGG
jgi:hypothetical protein